MAKRWAIFLILLKAMFSSLQAQVLFSDYFKTRTLRVDFILAGDFESEQAYLEKIRLEPFWGGRQDNLDAFHGLGGYQFQLLDNLTGNLIYVDGFSTLFEEWQTTLEAYKLKRSFYNSILMPAPFRKSTLLLIKREDGQFTDTLLQIPIDPASAEIKVATFPGYKVKDIQISAEPEKAIDIVLLAEGYKSEEINAFWSDAKTFATCLKSSKVFHNNLNRINIRAIGSVSENSGCDDPAKNTWKETCFNSTFHTIGIDRYLMSQDMNTIRNIAGMVPYDQVFILVNTHKYGGGGIFNFVNICSVHTKNFCQVVLHELGHGMAGLGDEYVLPDGTLLPDLSVEPWERNLTLFSGGPIKWQEEIAKGTPLPTPDALGIADESLTGLFVGGANAPEGIYRPSYQCRMRSNAASDFCIICEKTLQQMFDFYTGEHPLKP